MALWLEWSHGRNLPSVDARGLDEAEVARAWLAAVGARRDLAEDAAAFLAAREGIAPEVLARRLRGQTDYEREVLLGTLAPRDASGALGACRVLLAPTGGVPGPDALLAAFGSEPARAIEAVHALLPPGAAPALLLLGAGAAWLAGAARAAARLCAAVPSLVIAVAVEREVLEEVLRGSESQALALLREGLLPVEATAPPVLETRLQALGVNPAETLARSVARLAEDGATEELLSLFGEVARAGDDEPRARSAAERFLFQRLESLPWARGIFELNAPLPSLRPGARSLEVDLLSRNLRIAVEIDGFFHFREPERYRKDRRKDLELQRQGYVVLRFLANDVVSQLERILDTLNEVVSQRLAPAEPNGRE